MTEQSIVIDVNIIPDIFDYVNVLLSVLTIFLSVLAIYRTFKESKTSFEIEIYTLLQEAKTTMDNNIAQISDEEDEETINDIIDVNIENYLNAFNTACSMYNSGKINKKHFNALFLNDIKRLYDDDNFSDVLNKEDDTYSALKSYMQKFIK